MKRKFDTPLQEFDGDLYGRYIEIPQNIAEAFLNANIKRVMCSINSIAPIHSGIMPLGGGRWYINLNKKYCKTNGLMVGEILDVTLKEDRSKYGMDMPEVLVETLAQDKLADRYFHALTPGRQRTLIHMVNAVKSIEIQIRRALVISNHLKIHSGKIESKDLQLEMKEANRRGRI